jgi:hypothetical protein
MYGYLKLHGSHGRKYYEYLKILSRRLKTPETDTMHYIKIFNTVLNYRAITDIINQEELVLVTYNLQNKTPALGAVKLSL